MTLRNHQVQAISLIAVLLLCVPFVVFADGATFFQKVLWGVVVAFFGLFLGLAGALLDIAVNQFIIGFGTNFLQSGVGVAVDNLWVAVRDIFNLTFIFGLVFIGFKMILNSEDTGTRRWLISLLLAALLVNFSLYITKFIVDFTNLLATQIANAFPPSTAFAAKYPGYVSISDSFMNIMGLNSTLGITNGNLSGDVTGPGVYGVIFGTMILFIVMTFVFAAGAFMLIIRYAALCLYMVLSPLMFLGWVFPQLQSITSKYWSGFLGRAFFAPIYILMVYFSVTVLTALYSDNAAKVGTPDFRATLAGGGTEKIDSFATTFPPFILSCIFLIAAVVIASKLGADGASAAMSTGKNLSRKIRQGTTRMAGGATAGVGAWGMRNTVGRGADALTRSNTFKSIAANSTLGKYAYKAAQKGAQSSFDVRQVGGLGKATGLGTGATGGYKQSVTDRKKTDKEFLKAIKTDFNKDDPATKAKIAQRAAEIKDDATRLQSELAPRLKAEKDKAESERKAADTEYKTKEAELENNITVLEAELTENKQRGGTAFTPAERAERENELAKNKQELQKRKEEFKQRDLQLRTIEMEIDGKLKDIDSRINNAEKYATAETQYANEIAYMNKLEKDANFFNKASMGLAGGAAGSTAGVKAGSIVAGAGSGVAAGAGGVGLLLGYAGMKANADRINQSLQELRQEFGPGALKMAEKETKTKQLKELATAITEGNTVEKPVTPTAPETESKT